MAATDEMTRIALEHRPHQVSLVPERPEEITTEGGLDLTRAFGEVREACERLVGGGIAVSLFLDPSSRQVELARELFAAGVHGFEINTDAFTKAWLEEGEGTAGPRVRAELDKVVRAAQEGAEAGLAVYAGHGLTTANVGPIAALPQIEELNIGHSLVARAVIVGMRAAVQEMLAAMAGAAASLSPREGGRGIGERQ
jgi:pyridoxine 5-phosphate synthase